MVVRGVAVLDVETLNVEEASSDPYTSFENFLATWGAEAHRSALFPLPGLDPTLTGTV